MPSSLIQPSFSGGEVAPGLYGRVDLEKYQTSLRQCRNFIVRQYGGLENRPGTRFVAAAKYADKPCRLLPFQFNSEQTCVLELGDRYFRVFMRGEQVLRDGQPLEVATPWTVGDLPQVKYTQSADVMTLCHPNYPPLEIRRYGHDDWRTAELVTKGGPFDTVNTDEGATVYASGKTGSVTLTASRDIFKAWHVGKLFYVEQKNVDTCPKWESGNGNVQVSEYCRYGYNYYKAIGGHKNKTGTVAPSHTEGVQWDGFAKERGIQWQYVHSGIGILRLDNVAGDGRSAQASVITASDGVQELPGNMVGPENATYKWAHYAWNSHSGYPGTVAYYQQRLIFAGSNSQPQTVWTSRSGDYKDFGTANPVQDDDAITYTYAGRQLNQIRHLLDVGALVVLTSSGEYKVTGNQQGVLTPSAFQFSSQGQNGASHVQPISVSNVALFIQQKGSAVRDLAYSFDVDGFQGNDLTVLANHFFTGFQLVDWAFTITPLSVVWCVRNDGTLLGLTYLREQQVAAWHQHPGAGKYEAVCSISEGTEDALYCVVNRTIQGQPRRYVERLQSRIFERMEEAFFVDCGLSWDGRNHAPGNTLTLSGGKGDWPYDDPMTLTARGGARFSAQDVGNALHFPYQETGDGGRVEHKVLKLTVQAVVNDTTATVTSHRNVPARFQHVPVSDWQRARQTFSGLAHLEGQTVSILSDANVEPLKVVKDGRVTLEAPGAVVHVGLPISALMETLDVNINGNETLLDKKKLFTRVSVLVNNTRGIWAATPGGVFYEYAQRGTEFYDEPVAAMTGTLDVPLMAHWGKNGRVIIKQDDPLPMTLLAVIPRITLGGV